MTSPLQKILESKRALRRELGSLPIAEKLRMLDMMRERQLVIRPNVSQVDQRLGLHGLRTTRS